MNEEKERHRITGRELHYYSNEISPRRQAMDRVVVQFIDGLAREVARHWLFFLNLINGLIFAGAFAVPLLYNLGQGWLAGPLFVSYRLLCVQNPDHSYFIFGYQMAMDQRMTAIFGAIFASGIAFALSGTNSRPLSWRVYMLLLVPLAVDGFTQLFGFRHSNWELRTITGILFGFANVWLAYPQLRKYMALMRKQEPGIR